MRDISSAFWAKMQEDGNLLTEIIDLELPSGGSYHFTTTNAPITYTLSGASTVYVPFPGSVPRGVEESSDLGVSVVDFVMVNSHTDIQALLESDDFRTAVVKIGRVFVDTPDLDRIEWYHGTMGDFSYDRSKISGQTRNLWKSLSTRWPYYTYQDKCVWLFGSEGCGFDTSSITLAVTTIVVGSSTPLAIRLNTGSLNAYTAGRFDFGRLTVTAGPNSGHIRTIRTHTGDLLGLSHPLPINSMADMQLSIFPGCRKRLIEDCKSLYNNDTNFLGWPTIPTQETAW